jgi:hypothetical protein
VTSSERAELHEIRGEMREGFAEMRTGFALINGRVKALEMKQVADEAVAADRRVTRDRVASEKRWRLGLATGIGTSLGIGILNTFLSIVRP